MAALGYTCAARAPVMFDTPSDAIGVVWRVAPIGYCCYSLPMVQWLATMKPAAMETVHQLVVASFELLEGLYSYNEYIEISSIAISSFFI